MTDGDLQQFHGEPLQRHAIALGEWMTLRMPGYSGTSGEVEAI